MLDKRKTKREHEEISQNLIKLTDTEILLEYSKILNLIYPNLIRLDTHSYDEFDSVSEDLYFNTVYNAFSRKYGIIIDRQETHKYGFSLHCYHKINHINISPKQFPIKILSASGTEIEVTKEFCKTREFVFIDFGDTYNFFSGESKYLDLKEVNFLYSRFAIIDKLNGLTYKNDEQYWVKNSNIEFELVLEDYNKEEHEFYKMDAFADTVLVEKLENNKKKNKWKFWS